MHAGFRFEVYDVLMYIGAPARYVVHGVESKILTEQAAATPTQRLSLIAGKYVRQGRPGDDRALPVRAARRRRSPRTLRLPPRRGWLHARLAPRADHARVPRTGPRGPLRRAASRGIDLVERDHPRRGAGGTGPRPARHTPGHPAPPARLPIRVCRSRGIRWQHPPTPTIRPGIPDERPGGLGPTALRS